MHPTLSDGQRENDLEVARVNIYGELLDLQAGGMLHETIDPMHTADAVVRSATSACGTSSPAR